MDSPSPEEAKSELAVVEERISEVKDRIDRLKHLRNRWWQKRERAQIRNQKEKLAEANREVEKYDESLIRAKNALKQLMASRESLTARMQEAKQADGELATRFALLSAPERKRKLRKLKEIAEEG